MSSCPYRIFSDPRIRVSILDAHQFDANQMPFDGPTGIVSLVEHLLASAPHLGDEGKRALLDKFVRIILQQA